LLFLFLRCLLFDRLSHFSGGTMAFQ
jgi:hypothetical protein